MSNESDAWFVVVIVVCVVNWLVDMKEVVVVINVILTGKGYSRDNIWKISIAVVFELQFRVLQ